MSVVVVNCQLWFVGSCDNLLFVVVWCFFLFLFLFCFLGFGYVSWKFLLVMVVHCLVVCSLLVVVCFCGFLFMVCFCGFLFMVC